MEPFLFHGVKRCNLELLEKILTSGYIKPRCELEEGLVTDQNNIFNGTEYISLCQKSLFDGYPDGHIRVSFEEFIKGQITLVLKPDNIKLIFPNIIDLDFLSPQEWAEIKFKDGEPRYTYFEDEVQTKNDISLKDNLIAVGLPLERLREKYNEKEINDLTERLHNLMLEQGYDAPIIDSTMDSFADDYEEIEGHKIEPKGHHI